MNRLSREFKAGEDQRFIFTRSGREYFGIWVVNLTLSVLTPGEHESQDAERNSSDQRTTISGKRVDHNEGNGDDAAFEDAELRRETYQIVAGEPNSYIDGGHLNQFGERAVPGAQVFPGFRPSNEIDTGRNSVATYADVEANVQRRLRLGLAGRFEHYSDFGNTADGKLTVRLEPHREFVVRGAVSTGFRAPSLAQSYFSAISTNFLAVGDQLVPFEVGTFPVSSPQARVLGATDLQPEQSLHISGGLVWNPVAPLEIAADIYRVDIDDRIVISGNFTGGRITELLLPLGATGARFFTNAIDTRTKGADLTATYRADLNARTRHTRRRLQHERQRHSPHCRHPAAAGRIRVSAF